MDDKEAYQMSGGFKINRRGIAKMAKEIEKEFAKHPIRVPLETDSTGVVRPTMTNYYGPVVTVTGDHAQLAWGNDTVRQNQARREEIARGYELLAEALVRVLQTLPALGLSETETAQVESTADDVLKEITKAKPNRLPVERGVQAVKGLLASAALGLSAAVTDESKQLAVHLIEQLRQIVF